MPRDMFHGEFDGTHVAKDCTVCNGGIHPAAPMTDTQTLAFAHEVVDLQYTQCEGPELKALASMLIALNEDKRRIDGLLATRSWRQSLIKFGSREDIDAAILFGNPDRGCTDYIAPRTRCPICGIASAFGSHVCSQVGQRDLTGKPIFICPHPTKEHGKCLTCGDEF